MPAGSLPRPTLDPGNGALLDLYFGLPAPLRDATATAYGVMKRPGRFGRVFREFSRELAASAQWPPDIVFARQRARVEAIVRLAGASVPLYTKAFAERGIRAETWDLSKNGLESLPTLDKETVRLAGAGLVSVSFRGKRESTHTSGTTGKGLHLSLSNAALQRSYACLWHQFSWYGVDHGARLATVAGHPVCSATQERPPYWVTDWVGRERFFSSQHIMDRALRDYTRALAEFRPEVVRGYPSSLYALACHILQSGHSVPSPRLVVTSSETLLERQRRIIGEAFRCPVASYYSSAERTAHILECEMGRFHPLPLTGLVEVLDASGRPAACGEVGELVCTGLLDALMPLIRYETGDLAVLHGWSCECGRPGPVLSRLDGRIEDSVLTPDGRRVGRLDHAFKDALNVQEAQLVQESRDTLVVSLVCRADYSAQEESQIGRELAFRLGPSMRITFRYCDALDREPNGKLRFVKSRIAPPGPTVRRPPGA